MSKILCLVFLIFTMSMPAIGQSLSKSKVLAFTPELDTEINGIGVGLMINSLKFEGDTMSTIVNGLNLEIVGVGFFGPLVPSDPLAPYDVARDQIDPMLDSLIAEAKKPTPYRVNGLSLSLGGLAGHEVQLNGLNISGISTITSRTNGVSIALLMNINSVMHGLSVGFINYSLEHKGLQVGLINRSDRTKGIELGLWNKNEKRSLPLINWNF